MARRHLPIVVEQGLATIRINRTRAATQLFYRIGMDAVTCRKGCNHCCYYPVRISIFEGVLLYRELQTNQLWNGSLKLALERHSKQTYELASEVWLMSNIPCPLLSDNRCTAYGARPFVCRMTVSVGDPDRCRPAQFSTDSFVQHSAEAAAFNDEVFWAARSAQSRLMHLPLPISTAVLLGRYVVESGVGIDDLDRSVVSEFEAMVP
jgi:Fe-S-cluster containining protein